MRNKLILLFSLFYCSSSFLYGQQKPLPDFFLQKGGKNTVIVSWVNDFGDECIQLNVQRSTDSIRNFRTVFSTPAPQLPTNGFTDNNVPEGKIYYRIFYMLAGGAYYFTPSRQPGEAVPVGERQPNKDTIPDFQPEVVSKNTPANTVITKPLMISKNKWGNIIVKLCTPDTYNYRMEIYNLSGDRILFTINRFDNSALILDKSSFLKTGKYKYVIYHNEEVVERGMLDISK